MSDICWPGRQADNKALPQISLISLIRNLIIARKKSIFSEYKIWDDHQIWVTCVSIFDTPFPDKIFIIMFPMIDKQG
ncbi:hypothetical protein CW304_33060 [Bacillus sp. UFRGS-B20]|nr:hypothetical protein CW304_33060 [Bacillus sp. UFRGS-B20]